MSGETGRTGETGRIPADGGRAPGVALLRLVTLGYEAAVMDNVRALAELAAGDIAPRLPRRGGPGLVMTTAGQPLTPESLCRSLGGPEVAG
jgi:hypothetical protein